MGETFFKLSGAGNDFIALIEPEQDPPEEEIRAICARALSLGADGFLVLKRLPEGGIDLGYWNSDGGRCDFCLNGSRCAVQLAASAGLVDPNEFFRLKTDAGLLQGRCRGEHEAELRLPEGFAGEPRTRFLEVGGQSYAGFQVLVGVPHFVLPWEQNLATVPIAELGARLRHHQDLGPGGANVNFVRWLSPEAYEIRTFERGIEGETLACGSGVVASFRVGRQLGVLGPSAKALTSGGFHLELKDLGEGIFEIAGDARLIARGEWLPGAMQLPEPARWSD